MDYLDYNLSIGNDLKITASFLATSETDELKLDSEEIRFVINQLEDEKSRGDKNVIKNLGVKLASSLFTQKTKAHFYNVRSKNANKGFRIRLRIESPEVSNYPWEALYLDNRYMATSVETSLTRFFPNGTPAKRSFGKPMRIFVIGSNPSKLGLPAVQVDREIKSIEDSLKEEIDNGVIELDIERIGEIESIMDHLNKEQYNVIHFIGHGVFEDGVGYLALENSKGGLELADHERVGQIFQNQSSLGLIVLNACQGAKLSTDKAFTGLGSELIKMGVPSVIAMRYSITNQTARLFSKEFYKNLLKMPIDENLQMVRHRILVDADTDPRDFIIPVLFMNAPDGLIFSPENAAARELAQSPPCATRIEELKRAWDDLVGNSDALDERDLWLMISDIYESYEDSLDVRTKREIERMIAIVPVLLEDANEASLSGLDQEARRLRIVTRSNYKRLMDILKRRVH
jgi:hypothetical protein